MQNNYFTPADFSGRRTRIYDAIDPEAFALITGAGPVAGFEVPRQTNEFFYLTGINIAQAYLLLDGRRRISTLFVPAPDTHGSSEGTAPTHEALMTISGVDRVCPLDALTPSILDAKIVYTPHNPGEGRLACQDTLRHAAKLIAADPWDGTPSREQQIISHLNATITNVTVKDLSPILDTMRLIKDHHEIDCMRAAGKLCASGVLAAIAATGLGVYEYQLGAEADYLYRMAGVRYEGYRAIIAGGENIWYAHYFQNDCPLADGDLVLMDYAPDISNYTSDIGRMWPVNGKYSPVQRELYGFIVEYHKHLLNTIRPGVLPEQILAETAEQMRPIIERTAFSKEIYQQAALRTLTFRGHLSHPVGMAVHDVGKYFDRPLEPGLTIAVDPQMWIPEEKLYIRVEDTIVVTETGIEVLTQDVPWELDEIEALMAAQKK